MNGYQPRMTSPRSRAGGPVREAEQAGQRLEKSKTFGLLVMVGLIAYGVVHLLIAWIALQLAWTGGGGEASQQGAMAQMAGNPLGDVLLWITAVGLFALTVWQGFTAVWGYQDEDSRGKKIWKRLGAAGKAVVYLGLGISAVSTAVSGSKSGDSKEKTLTASLMSVPFGRILVAIVGLAVLGVGGRLVYRGIAKKFTKDLRGGVGPGVTRLGQIGFCAKGVALGIVGALFVVAAITFDPNQAGGLDEALRTLRQQPYGQILLTVVALGIACFGLYCFAWSRRANV